MSSVSIVVETVTVGEGGDSGRANLRQTLTELSRQVQAYTSDIELVFVADDVEAATALVAEVGFRSNASVRVIDSGGRWYYEMKNLGASVAGGDVVVFLDSDTCPQPGWLAALTEPFDDPEVQFTAGTVSLGPTDDLFSRTMSLTSRFPVRTDDGPRRRHDRFWANNFAARSTLLSDHPFEPNGFRHGACWDLSRRLLAEGVTIWEVPNARLVHVCPERKRMLDTAFALGRDMLETERFAGRSVARGWLVLSAYCAKQALRPFGRHGRTVVGLPARGIPGAFALAMAYNAAQWLGLTYALRPGLPPSSRLADAE